MPAPRSAHNEALLHLQRALDLLAAEPESIERDRRELPLQQTLVVELFAGPRLLSAGIDRGIRACAHTRASL